MLQWVTEAVLHIFTGLITRRHVACLASSFAFCKEEEARLLSSWNCSEDAGRRWMSGARPASQPEVHPCSLRSVQLRMLGSSVIRSESQLIFLAYSKYLSAKEVFYKVKYQTVMQVHFRVIFIIMKTVFESHSSLFGFSWALLWIKASTHLPQSYM